MAIQALYWIWLLCVGILVACLVYSCCRSRIEGFQELRELPTLITRTQEPRGVGEIPFDVYQCWNTRTVPQGMYDTVTANASENPEFNFHFYDDDMCRAFIQDNFEKEVLDAFDALKPGAYKADLWRLCILYKNGGVYIDAKYKIVKSLKEIISDNTNGYVKDRIYQAVYNGFIVSKANDHILKKGIDKIVENAKNRNYGSSCLNVSGPTMLGPIVYINNPETIKYAFDEEPNKIGVIKNINTNEVLMRQYSSYRYEQTSNGTPHYEQMWNSHDIYN